MAKIIRKKRTNNFNTDIKIVEAPINNISSYGKYHIIKLADSHELILDEADMKFIIDHRPQNLKEYLKRKRCYW
tara:strand:+ start:1565 stop:1786 length:222 start_codon:yes stop_codon:yes gene_type:complete